MNNQGNSFHLGARSSRTRAVAARLLSLAVAALTIAWVGDAKAALVVQMARCTPPIEDPVPDPVAGYGNDPANRKFFVNFAYAASAAGADRATDIAATHRVEICTVSASGTFNCPGWDAGGNAWVVFDDSRGIGTKPDPSVVKTDPGAAAADSNIQLQNLPIDWDSATDTGKILFFVVNAASKPGTLASVSATIQSGGFCGVTTRIAAGSFATPASASTPGSTAAAGTTFVVYGIPEDFAIPAGWTFGSPCSAANKAQYGGYAQNQCAERGAAIFGLDRLAGVDDWQFNTAQAGLRAFGVQKNTWRNGSGGPGNTCPAGATCPTRAFFMTMPRSAGYGWAGLYSEVNAPYSGTCGDGILQDNEQCDGVVPAGTTCQTLGFGPLAGTLACNPNCSFDTSGCLPPIGFLSCPNGTLNAGEQCDTTVPAGTTCQSLGFGPGTLTCNPNCGLNTSGCAAVEYPFSGDAESMLRTHSHEYFHGLEETWRRATSSDLYGHLYFLEPTATVMEAATCLTSYPGTLKTTIPPNRCVSARTLYGPFYTYGGVLAANDFLQFPENPLQTYPGVLFYRYVAAQFAYPQHGTKAQLAHLASASQQVDSTSQVLYEAAPNDQAEKALVNRRPDEGLDLMGYFFAAFDTSGASATPCNAALPAGADITQRISCVLEKYVGRTFDDELLEFHTMMVLKDYKDTDERWRMEWLGDYNDGAASPIYPGAPVPVGIKGQKPFVQATSTGGTGYPVTFSTPTPDGLVRVKRVQDTYNCTDPNNCAGANLTVNTLAAGQTLASAQPVSMSKWGSAYVSVHPDPAYGTLGVRLKVERGSPRFRIFTIDNTGTPTLVPACAAAPTASEACPVNALDGTASVDIPIQATTDEVLIVASAKDESAFSWRFGPDQARLRIVSPTTASPAIIGGFDAGTLKAKPFVLYFTATDVNDAPIDTVGSTDLVVKAGGTPCTFNLTGFSGGSYMAVVTVPASVYPAAAPATAQKFDLGISLASGTAQPDTAPQALVVTPDLEKAATEFVIDVSGSMGVDNKLDNTKKAAHLVLDGLSDDDYAGLSVFSTHSLEVKAITQLSAPNARTDLSAAIDSLTAGGSTAIGNGLYRGQDALAKVFDVSPPAGTVKQGIVLLSDGKSNCPWTPLDYVYYDQSGDAALATCANCECNIDTVPTIAPWPADQSTAPYETASVGYFSRRGGGLALPTISVIGIGPDPDMGTLGQLATLTGGTQFKDPIIDPITLALELTDGFRTAMGAFSGYERSLATDIANLGALPAFDVDQGTDSMLISIASFFDPADAVLLVTPSGVEIGPDRATAERAVFRVRSPQVGRWGFHSTRTGTGSPTVPNTAFVEVAVRSPCHLLVRTEVKNARVPRTPPATPPAPGAPVEDQRWTGDEIMLEAVVHDGLPKAGATVLAAVEAPDGTATPVLLQDDGRHGDGRANDGLYGARYLNTGQPGAYRVRYFSSTPPSSGKACSREQRDVIALHAAPDSDANTLPDWWQQKYGVTTGAEFNDPDRDGVPTLLEFFAHTRPDASDTDGGGESDQSELTAGRNPNDAFDDATGAPQLFALPGNGHVVLALGVPVPSGASLEIQSSPTRDGAFSPDQTYTSNPGPVIVLNATNGVQRCYSARVLSSIATSAWSSPTCATPNADPVPPQIRSIALAGGGPCARSRQVNIKIDAQDSQFDSRVSSEIPLYRDSAVTLSGISSMQVTTSVNHAAPAWVPFQPTVPVDFGDATKLSVTVKLRDGAGNETPNQMITLTRCDGMTVDRAISLEERAIDRFNAKDCNGARTLLQQSVTEINKSITNLTNLRATVSASDQSLIDKLILKLKHVRSEKNDAILYACLIPFSFRVHEVQEALDEENEVIALALTRAFQL